MRWSFAALAAASSLFLSLPSVAQTATSAPAMPAASTAPAMSAAPSAVEATPIPLPPKPNFAPLAYFLGTWSCSTKSSRRPTAQLSTVTYAAAPGGRWITYTTSTKPTSWYPYAVRGTDYVTYDRDAKRWVDVGWDSTGGYTYSTTSGWNDATLIWKDGTFVPTAQAASESDFTITKVSATKFTTEYGFTTGKEKSVAVKGVCTKV